MHDLFSRSTAPFLLLMGLTAIALTGCTTANQKNGYCEDCLTQTSRQKLQGKSAPAMYQRATELAAKGQKAERDKRFAEAFRLYSQAIETTERLAKDHPKSTSALKLKNSPNLGSISIASIKLDKIPRLRQQSLITSGILGWAQYSIESIEYEYSRTDPMMHLAEIYAELGDDKNARRVLAILDGVVPQEERNWQRKRLKEIETYLDNRKTAHNAKVAASWAGCILSPGVCHVVRTSHPQRIIAPLVPPAIHQSNSLNRWGRSSRMRELLEVDNHTAALRYAMMTPNLRTRSDLLLDVARYGRREKKPQLIAQSLSLFEMMANTIPDTEQRIYNLRRLYWYHSSKKEEKTQAIQVLKNVRMIAKTLKDPIVRLRELSRIARELAYQKEVTTSKEILGEVTRELAKVSFTDKNKKQRDTILSSISSTYAQLKDFDQAWNWYQQIEKKEYHNYLYGRIQEGYVSIGKKPDLAIFKDGKPSSSKTSGLLRVAKAYAQKKNKKEALAMVPLIEQSLTEREEAKKDTWSLQSHRIELIEVYAMLKLSKKVTTALEEMLKKAKTVSSSRSNSDRLRAYSRLLKLVIEQKDKKVYKKVYNGLKDEIRSTKRYYSVAYAIKDAIGAYLKTRRYDDMFKLIETISQEYYRIRAVGEVARLYMRMKPEERDPKLPSRLLAIVNSYANKPNDASASFREFTIMCANPKIKCLDQLVQMAKDLDKRSTSRYSSAARSLAYNMTSEGHFKQAMSLIDALKNDYDKARVLSDITTSWGRKSEYRKAFPNILDDVQAKAKTLPKNRQTNITSSMMQALANAKQCARVMPLIEKLKADKKSYYRVYEQERAAILCMMQGDITTALKIASAIRTPYNRARAILQLGYYIDGSGYAKHPEVQKLLQEVAFDAYSRKKNK